MKTKLRDILQNKLAHTPRLKKDKQHWQAVPDQRKLKMHITIKCTKWYLFGSWNQTLSIYYLAIRDIIGTAEEIQTKIIKLHF